MSSPSAQPQDSDCREAAINRRTLEGVRDELREYLLGHEAAAERPREVEREDCHDGCRARTRQR